MRRVLRRFSGDRPDFDISQSFGEDIRRVASLGAFALVTGLVTSSAHAFTFAETFSGHSVDGFWWTAATGGGNTLAQTGGRLELSQNQADGWFGESCVAHFSGVGDGVVPLTTTDTSGTLRLARSVRTLTGSFWNGAGWTDVRSFTAAAVAADAQIGLAIWNGYASVPVRVAFDNFTLSAPDMVDPSVPAVPEPGTYAMLLAGLATVAGVTRRRARVT